MSPCTRTSDIEFARSLRRRMTPAERVLWRHLRDRRLDGLKFRRQAVLCGFYPDFLCAEARLVLEVDGASHIGRERYDAMRAAVHAREGYATIRVTNREVRENLDGVLAFIRESARSRIQG